MNDLWKYDLDEDRWYHIKGNKTVNMLSNYIMPYAFPGGIHEHPMILDSADRYLYVFGGWGYDGYASGFNLYFNLYVGALNDFWKYDLMNDMWIYITGNQTRNFPYDPSLPYPGGLSKHSLVFDEANLIFYVFGGGGYGVVYTGIKYYLINS